MGFYIMVTNRLFLGLTGGFGMEKASGSTAKVSSNLVKKLEIANYSIEFYLFPDVSCG